MRWCWVAVAMMTCVAGLAPAEDVVPAAVEAMYVRGLESLVKSQQGAGNWTDGEGSGPGVVGVAVLAMLAHGEDPNDGLYSVPIKRGLNFILGKQDAQSGYIGGTMYHHGFATLALAEAYGAVEDERLGPALKRAVGLIVAAQARNSQGAWRYTPGSPDADTTVSGAQMVALLAARNAGIAVPEEAVQKGMKFFLSCQSEDGGLGYTGPGDPNDTRTAIGAVVFALARQKEARSFRAALGYLRGSGAPAAHPYYHEYYMAQALFHGDTELWRLWSATNTRRLAAAQLANGSWEGAGGSTFCTSAALLSLAVNYRFLPIYER